MANPTLIVPSINKNLPVVLPDLLACDKVLFRCTCGQDVQLFRMYFCTHCSKTRCRVCVSHEVNSQYCQHCLEYIPTIDAKLKKNKCSTCFQCPTCAHILTTKVNVTQVPSEADPEKMVPKKMYYLVCLACGWSTRDVGIPDQTSLVGGWPEIQTPNEARIEQLYEHYRALAQREKFDKLEKEIRRYQPGAGRAIHLLDKYGISASLSPKVSAFLRAKIYGGKMSPGISVGSLLSPTSDSVATVGTSGGINQQQQVLSPSSPDKGQPGTVSNIQPSEAGPIEPFDVDKYYSPETPPDLKTISSINQRLFQLEIQPDLKSQFRPVSKTLLVKRAYRCKECDRNLCKPEYNPSSIKFKILLCAFYHVPELKIKTIPNLKAGEEVRVELTLSNPIMQPMTVVLHAESGGTRAAIDGDRPSGHGRVIHAVSLPDGELKLAARDPTAELDVDQNVTDQFKDDPKIISFRKAAKIGFWISVTPHKDSKEGDEVTVTFRLAHDLQQVQVSTDQANAGERESKTTWLTHRIQLKLGPISRS